MPRLRNSRTGVVVNVSDATATRLGDEWTSAEGKPEPAPKKKTPARRRKAASSDDE